MLYVNVNADMTKYLPDKSQMKHGLEIVNAEFGSSAQMSGADVHVMFKGLSPAETPGMSTLLAAFPDVNGVSYRYNTDSTYTVFDLDVPKSVDQKTLGKQISNRFGGNCVVETSQDGATPPISVMIIAAGVIMLILFLMAQSWFEPVVILISAGMAILLNMGTNALLPSVSITTNFIGSILQAVLSLDYCIVLLNRYRQEQDEHTDRESAVLAANRALRNAAPSILSSALTTIVGLLMLCFMRLKIGADMGIVLAKGVLCSLICTFTVMPSLMLIFRRVINKTAKKVYVPPTDGLARFVTSHKVTMAIFAVLLFFVSWYFSRKTTIFFSAEADSQIEQIFPSPNPFVLVYDTQDEDSILPLVDTLMEQEGIQTVISYPTLLSSPLTPAEMTEHVRSLSTLMDDFMPDDVPSMPAEAMNALTPEIVQLVYFMRSTPTDTMQLDFPSMARFLHTHCANNPLFATYIDADMRQQIELLQSMLDMPAAEPEPETKPAQHKSPQTEKKDSDTIVVRDTTHFTPITNPSPITDIETVVVPKIEVDKIAVVPFMDKLYAAHPTSLTLEMRSLSDTIAIRMPMTVNEMATFIGSTPTQTRLVYGYAPGKAKQLTPLQYVHLLVDDLFQRKGLQGMISLEQRTMLEQRAHLMDLADANASITPKDLNMLLRAFGVNNYTDDQLFAMAYPPKAEEPKEKAQEEKKPVTATATSIDPSHLIQTPEPITSALDAKAQMNTTQKEPAPVRPSNTPKRPSRADQQAELFTELMFGEHTYTSDQMAKKLSRLVSLSDSKAQPITEGQMSLLYAYYGSTNSRCDTVRLGLDVLLKYLCDTLVYDPRLEDIIPAEIREQASGVQAQLMDGMGQLRQEKHSLLVVLSSLPAESPETYAFVDTLTALADARLPHEHYYVGESVMYAEMRAGFDHEMNVVTLLTILAIFLIVAVTFRSVIVPTILVVTVMTAVYVNVVVAGLVTGQMLYLAYLIVQAILMGATIDYGILLANYYREFRKTMLPGDAARSAYRGSIRTILTSGLIMILGPGAMALLIDDLMISNIVGCLAVGAFVAVVLILTVVPAILVALDKWVVYGKKNRFTASETPEENAKS